MGSSRFKKIAEIYTKVAAPVDWDEEFKKLNMPEKPDESKKPEAPTPEPDDLKSQVMKHIEEEPKKPAPPKEPLELPEQLKEEVQYPVQPSLFPGEAPTYPAGIPFKKIYSPSFSMSKQCPICKSKLDPIEQLKGKITYREECPKCKYIYNRMQKLVQNQNLTPQEAINFVFNEKHKRYNPDALKTIWESGGNISILDEPIIRNEKPGISTRVHDFLRFNLNVKKNVDGNIIYNKHGFPIPLQPPKFFTTHELAKKLEWHPDHVVEYLEGYGHSPLPIGGISRGVVPNFPPPERDMTENERILRSKQKLLDKLTYPEKTIDGYKSELASLKKELSQFETPGGPEMEMGLSTKKRSQPIGSPEQRRARALEIKEHAPIIMKQIQEVQQIANRTPLEYKQQLEREIKELGATIKQEQKEEIGRERFKTSWYNVWNLDKIKGDLKERLIRIEQVIKPLKKLQYFGSKYLYFDQLADKAAKKKIQDSWSNEGSYLIGSRVKGSDNYIYKARKEDGQNIDPVLEKNKEEKDRYWVRENKDMKTAKIESLDPYKRKAFKLLQVLQQAKNASELAKLERKFKITKKSLEKHYGKSLDMFLSELAFIEKEAKVAAETEQENLEKAEDYFNRFRDISSLMGLHKWKDPDTGESIKTPEIMDKIDDILGIHTESIPKRGSLYFRQAADPKQLSLWEEEEEKEEEEPPRGSSIHFFGPGTQHKPVQIMEKDPIESIAPTKKPSKKEEDEDEMEVKLPEHKFIEPTPSEEKEPQEFTKTCPYSGCGAKISEDATQCWKCKTPMDTKNTVQKVVKGTIRITQEVERKDPITGEITKEKVTFYPPKFSLITIGLNAEGKPQSVECRELPYSKRPGSRPVPSHNNIWEEAQKEIKEMLESPDYSDEQKKKIKDRSKYAYELLFKQKQEEGEIHSKTNPWQKQMPAIGVPRITKQQVKRPGLSNIEVTKYKGCDKCPDKMFGPFTKEKLDMMCPEMIKGLKSMTKSVANVWPYKEVRHITEKEREAGQGPEGKKTESRPYYYADDKTASRFDKILALSQKD